jgi:hypothetical protein
MATRFWFDKESGASKVLIFFVFVVRLRASRNTFLIHGAVVGGIPSIIKAQYGHAILA